MSTTAITEPDQIHVGRHILKLFERLRRVEARLTEIERSERGRRKPVRKATAEPDPLAAREVRLAKRKAEREADRAGIVPVEPLSGGGLGIDSFSNMRRILNGDS